VDGKSKTKMPKVGLPGPMGEESKGTPTDKRGSMQILKDAQCGPATGSSSMPSTGETFLFAVNCKTHGLLVCAVDKESAQKKWISAISKSVRQAKESDKRRQADAANVQ
jgi:hypothetical protein